MPWKSTTVAARLWAGVLKSDTCWEWQRGHNGDRYGVIWVGGERQRDYVHRVSWVLHYGPIPDGLWVLHQCDNPPCVRPDHLFLGTNLDNARDMAAKGRQVFQQHPERAARGDQSWMRSAAGRAWARDRILTHGSPFAKLSADKVKTIRILYSAGGITQRALAQQYGVSQPAISSVVSGRRWGHVDAEAIAKSRPDNRSRGSGSREAKLTEAQVVTIRKKWAGGVASTRNLAREYGVTQRAIVCITKRLTWKHI